MKRILFSKKTYAMLLSVILLCACTKNATPDAQSEKTTLNAENVNQPLASLATDNLVFQSGFEPGSSNIPRVAPLGTQTEDIVGNTTGLANSDWQYHLETKTPIKFHQFRLNYEGGTYTDRRAEIIPNPVKDVNSNNSNTVLKFRLTNAVIWDTYTYKGRVVAEEFSQNLAPGATPADQAVGSTVKEYYQKVKFYLPTDFDLLQSSTFPSSGDWLLFWEFRDQVPTTTGKDSRITIDVTRPNTNSNTKFNFVVTCQEMNDLGHSLWTVSNTNYQIVAGKWLEAEIYIKEGGPGVGRTYFAVRDVNAANTGQWYTLCDQYGVTNINHLNTSPQGFNGFTPMKLYCSASVLKPFQNVGKSFVMYWDDLEMHENRLPSPGAITP
jgi:hypothetical protein